MRRLPTGRTGPAPKASSPHGRGRGRAQSQLRLPWDGLRWGGQRPLFTRNLSCLASDFLSPVPPASSCISSGVISSTESLELKSLIQGLFLGEPSFYVAHSSFTRNPGEVKMWPHPPQWSLQWAPCPLHASGWPSQVATMGLGPHFQLRVSPTPLSSLRCSSAPRLLLVACLVSGGPAVYEAPSGLSEGPSAGSGSSSVS